MPMLTPKVKFDAVGKILNPSIKLIKDKLRMTEAKVHLVSCLKNCMRDAALVH